MNEIFDTYDAINTYAVKLLVYNQQRHTRPIGINNFSSRDITHRWMLHMMESFSVYKGYATYYVNTNIFTYLYLRFIKKYKHLRLTTNSKSNSKLMIDVNIFINELTETFGKKPDIIKDIYNLYWGD